MSILSDSPVILTLVHFLSHSILIQSPWEYFLVMKWEARAPARSMPEVVNGGWQRDMRLHARETGSRAVIVAFVTNDGERRHVGAYPFGGHRLRKVTADQ